MSLRVVIELDLEGDPNPEEVKRRVYSYLRELMRDGSLGYDVIENTPPPQLRSTLTRGMHSRYVGEEITGHHNSDR